MAGSKSLGTLTIDLVVKAGAFTAGMNAAERQADKSLSSIEKRAYNFGKNLGTALKAGAVLATAALGAVAVAVGQAIDRADEMRDLSIRTGVATEALSAYAYAAKQTGTDIEGLGRGLKLLAKNAAEALDPKSKQFGLFNALGINVKDAEGNLKNLEDLLPDIANKFKGMEDGTLKTAIALKLFGKSGAELIEFLNQGSSGLEAFAEKAQQLGIIIGSDTAAAADEFNDKLADLKEIANGFANQLAAEMLPRLIELIDKLNESAKGGKLLGTSVQDVGGLFDLFAGQVDKANEVGNSTRLLFAGISTQIGIMKAAFADLMNLNFSGYFSGLLDAAKQAYQNLKTGFGLQADFSGVTSSVFNSRARNARGGSNRLETGGAITDVAAINKYFATGSSSSSKKTGKTEAEKAAERLAKAIRKMTDAQREWQTELDGTGNKVIDDYNKRLDEITEKTERFAEDGIPKDKIAAFRQEMTKLAEQLKTKEISEFSKDFSEGTAQIGLAIEGSASPALLHYQKEIRELDKVLKSGAINQKEYEERLKALGDERNSQAINIRKDLEFEISLLGLTADEQERLTLARQLGADAATAQGQAAIEALKEYQGISDAMADQVEAMDAIRDASKDFLKDLITGSKSFKDAFIDALSSIEDKLLDMVLQNFADQLFGKQGDPAGGSTGGFWASLFGAFFGGAKATGGSVMPGKFYRVNENGTEMFSQGGKDYLMTGSHSGVVTPNNKLGSGIKQQVINMTVQGRIDRRAEDQIAREIALKTRMATGRF